MRRPAFLHLGLAVLLLFAQTIATAHGFAHLNEPVPASGSHDQDQPHSNTCEQCIAAAALDAGMPSISLAVETVALNPLVAARSAVSSDHRPVPAYSSRAPPRFV